MNIMRSAIFDLDGTILDSLYLWDELDKVFLRRHGGQYTPQIKAKVEALTLEQSSRYFIELLNLNMSVSQVMQEWQDMLGDYYASKLQLRPYVLEYIQKLHGQGVKMCIATITQRHLAMSALRRTGLLEYMEFVSTGDDTALIKKHINYYDEILKKLDSEKNSCMVFEDAYYAAKTASDSGFNVIGVYDPLSTVGRSELESITVRCIDCFSELL